jgi:hypothetical protein
MVDDTESVASRSLAFLRGFAIATAVVAPLGAGAKSLESVPVSPEAAIVAGAVLASDDFGGGGWYNPASLGAVSRSSIQVGASAYAESVTRMHDAAQVTLPWGAVSGDITSARYSSVPSVLSYAFRLREGLGVSIGVWTPYHDYDGGSTLVTSAGAYPSSPYTAATYAQTYAFTERRDDTWGGIGVGWQATQRLRIGAMVQGAYSTDVWSVDMNASLATNTGSSSDSGSHLAYSERGDGGVLGLRTLFGAQLQLTDRLRLAAAVRGPTIRVYAWGLLDKFLSYGVLMPAVAPPAQGQTAIEQRPARGVSAIEPVRLYFGGRWAEERWTFAAEGDWHPGLDGEFGAFTAGWNARAGGTWQADPDLTLGAGAFVDSSSQEASATVGAMRYAGLTTGAIYRPSKVVKALRGSKDWDLLTAVAVRGAFGWGSYRGVQLAPINPSVAFPDRLTRTFEGSISFFTTIVF